MKKYFTIIILVIIFISPCFSQEDLDIAYPNEITCRDGITNYNEATCQFGIAYFKDKPFTGLLVDGKTNKRLGEFRNGYKNGVFTEYYSNGKLKSEVDYLHGKLNGKYISYNEKGNKEYEANYELGLEDGQEIYYHSNGKIKATFNYKRGKIIDGIYSIYKDDGSIEKTEHYEYKNCIYCNVDSKQNCSYCGGTGKSSEIMITLVNLQSNDNLEETAIKQQAVPESTLEEDIKPFLVVEQMPEFVGGTEELMNFLKQNIKYPKMARETGIAGTVLVQFVVGTDGKIYDLKILRGIGGGCDEEAIEVIKSMPNWNPGKQDGVTVPVLFQLPIKFSLKNKL